MEALDKSGVTHLWGNIKNYVAENGGGSVWKNTRVSGEFYKSDDAPISDNVCKLDGFLYATRVYNAVWNDYAELFRSNKDEIDAGCVVYANKDGTVASTGNPRCAVGVVSDRYGHLIGGNGDPHAKGWVPIALCGRVPVKVCGSVNVGDLLAAKSDGSARRARLPFDYGRIIGKCVGADPDGRSGYVDMLVAVV